MLPVLAILGAAFVLALAGASSAAPTMAFQAQTTQGPGGPTPAPRPVVAAPTTAEPTSPIELVVNSVIGRALNVPGTQ